MSLLAGYVRIFGKSSHPLTNKDIVECLSQIQPYNQYDSLGFLPGRQMSFLIPCAQINKMILGVLTF